MKKLKNAAFILSIFFSALLLASCVTVGTKPPKKTQIKAEAGRTIPFYGLSIDANEDPRLDDIFENYKLLPILIKNASLTPTEMDVVKDRWEIVGDNGKVYKALNTIRLQEPVLWRETSKKIKNIIDYPEIIPINYSVTFDLFLPKKADLKYFRAIRYFNAATRKEFVLEKRY